MNMDKQTIIIVIVAVLVIIVSCGCIVTGSVINTSNKAVQMEETVKQASSDIGIGEKRRYDLIMKLVQVVEQASQYEQSTLVDIVKLRQDAQDNSSSISATNMFKIVMENYPTLQANQNYIELMNELSITENMLSELRKTRNSEVKNYNQFVKTFPNTLFLAISGHLPVDFGYLEYSEEETAMPDNLFSK